MNRPLITAFVIAGLATPLAAYAGPKLEIIAHRGASYDAPENTVASFRLAWEQNADAGELDIFQTKDGKIVVLHDKDTKRVAGVDKKVVDQTFAELRMLDVGRWKNPKYASERIPTLEEMLATVPSGKRVFVEIKPDAALIPELDRVLKSSKLKPEQTPIISFHAEVIAAIKKARPDLPAYWIVSLKSSKGKQPPTAEALIARAKEIQADGLDLSAVPELDRTWADKVRAANLKLYVWTVNDAQLARRMAEIGVDGITTDRPAWLREQLSKPTP